MTQDGWGWPYGPWIHPVRYPVSYGDPVEIEGEKPIPELPELARVGLGDGCELQFWNGHGEDEAYVAVFDADHDAVEGIAPGREQVVALYEAFDEVGVVEGL